MTGDDLERTLGRIEGKLDEALPLLHGLNGRVRALEVWRGVLAGGMAVITAILGWLGWSK